MVFGNTVSQRFGSDRRGADGVRVEKFQGFTTLGILDEIQKVMTESKCEPISVWNSTWTWDSWQTSSACQNFNLLENRRGGSKQYTCRAPFLLMHSCCAVLLQSSCHSVQSHIDPLHLHGSSHHAHCLRFAQKHSHLIAQCRTPCRT